MRWFHLTMAVWISLNGVAFIWIAVRTLRVYRTAISAAVRVMASALMLLSVTFVMGSIQRVGLQLFEAGVLGPEVDEFLVTWWQAPIAAVISASAILILARIHDAFSYVDSGERVVSVLTERVAFAPAVSEWGLTARELEVLEKIGEGVRSDSEIAEALFISPSTAATHVRNILRKAGLRNRNDLMFAVRRDAT